MRYTVPLSDEQKIAKKEVKQSFDSTFGKNRFRIKTAYRYNHGAAYAYVHIRACFAPNDTLPVEEVRGLIRKYARDGKSGFILVELVQCKDGEIYPLRKYLTELSK